MIKLDTIFRVNKILIIEFVLTSIARIDVGTPIYANIPIAELTDARTTIIPPILRTILLET